MSDFSGFKGEYIGRNPFLGKTRRGKHVGGVGLESRSGERCIVELKPEEIAEVIRKYGIELDQQKDKVRLFRVDEVRPGSVTKDRDVMLYDAGFIACGMMCFTNGAQTDYILKHLAKARKGGVDLTPGALLVGAMQESNLVWSEIRNGDIDVTADGEPDTPNFTDRVCVARKTDGKAALYRVSRGGDAYLRTMKTIQPGEIHSYSTYAGPNVPSAEALPRASPVPRKVFVNGESAEEIGKQIWSSRESIVNGRDIRQAVIVMVTDPVTNEVDVYRKNMIEKVA